MFAMQRVARQLDEDGPNPCIKWAQDRIGSDLEDPDSEHHMSIPDVGSVPVSGKPRSRDPLLDWSDDDSEDCQILEVHNVIPLAYKPPVPRPPVDSANQVQGTSTSTAGNQARTRKRPSAESNAAEPLATPVQKRVKKAAPVRGRGRRPVSHG